ncbi:hypothetical protein AXF42_Ash008982 [Apostasia shenzhenica]|uniref:Uncharacterized protein n=1 Tax=Apostasia shenzhenica TaxID=1088818 RepID=A0A2I0AT15_9ASPA|nr:hypothetical protein AXF42_Ash008982 [Apostasia shenzhenica]
MSKLSNLSKTLIVFLSCGSLLHLKSHRNPNPNHSPPTSIDPISFIFSRLSTIAMAYLSSTAYRGDLPTLETLIARIQKSWKQPAITLIYIELLNTVSASLLLLLASAARAAGGSASEAAAIAGGVVVAGSWLRSAIFAYSEVDLKVGMVVSVVEGCGGEKAVKRAGKLIEGRKMEGFGLMVGTMMVEGMIGKILGLGLGLGLGSAAGALEAMMGKFLTYFGYTAFYYECKRRKG